MKYLVFLGIACTLVPLIALVTATSRGGRCALLALLVLCPVLGNETNINFWSLEQYRGTDRGFEITLTDLLAAGMAVGLLIRGRLAAPLPYNGFVLLACLAWGGANLLVTPEPVYSAFTLFKGLRCGLLYWVVVNGLTGWREVRAVLWGWTAAGLVLALTSAVQKYGFGVYRVSGPFDHSNTMPVYINLVLAVVSIWGLTDRRLSVPGRALVLSSVLGMLFATLSTFSRAGILLSGAAFFGAAGIAAVRARSARTLVGAALAMVLGVAGGIKAAPRVVERFQHAATESHAAREEFNLAAWRMIEDNPLGVGLNAFSEVMTSQERYRDHVVVMAHETTAGVAHNIYLLTAAELGYPGLVLLVLVTLRFLWAGVRCALTASSPADLYASGAVIGMLALHTAGALEWAFRITPVAYQFFLVCGFVVALRALDRASRRSR